MVAAGLLFGALEQGAPTMAAQAGVSSDIVTVIQALIVVFVARAPADPRHLPPARVAVAADSHRRVHEPRG